jgi:hypothetical protein
MKIINNTIMNFSLPIPCNSLQEWFVKEYVVAQLISSQGQC